jgi:hypothetical protein
MPRRKKPAEETPSLLDITAKLRSGPCVPPLREAMKAWQATGRKGLTDTTQILLNHWFATDHKLKTGKAISQSESLNAKGDCWLSTTRPITPTMKAANGTR